MVSDRNSDPASSLVVGEAQEFNIRLETSDSWLVPTTKTVRRNWLNACQIRLGTRGVSFVNGANLRSRVGVVIQFECEVEELRLGVFHYKTEICKRGSDVGIRLF